MALEHRAQITEHRSLTFGSSEVLLGRKLIMASAVDDVPWRAVAVNDADCSWDLDQQV
jgi:hypothetical protein